MNQHTDHFLHESFLMWRGGRGVTVLQQRNLGKIHPQEILSLLLITKVTQVQSYRRVRDGFQIKESTLFNKKLIRKNNRKFTHKPTHQLPIIIIIIHKISTLQEQRLKGRAVVYRWQGQTKTREVCKLKHPWNCTHTHTLEKRLEISAEINKKGKSLGQPRSGLSYPAIPSNLIKERN